MSWNRVANAARYAVAAKPGRKRKRRAKDKAKAKAPKRGAAFWKSEDGQAIIAARRAHADWSGLDRW